MKNILNKLTMFTLIVVTLSCVDESLDPFRLNEIIKGSILALRGTAVDRLNDNGCSNSFFKDGVLASHTFSFEADFLAEDQSLLESVQMFVIVTPAVPGGITKARTALPTASGTSSSDFVVPSGANFRNSTISVSLADIKTAAGLSDADLATFSQNDMTIEADITLTDGSVVSAANIVNGGLFQSAIFFPAHILVYCAIEIDDAKPAASTKLLGTVVKNSAGETTSRPVLPRRDGVTADLFAIDTVLVSYNKDIITPPIATVDVGSVSAVIPAEKKDTKGNYTGVADPRAFWVVFTSTAQVPAVTGQATVTLTGATALDVESGVTLTQNSKTQKISVDNEQPINLSVSAAGGLLGRNQFITISATFHEALVTAPKITVTGQNLDAITAAKMTISSTNPKTATYIYIYKDSNQPTDVMHGNVAITIEDGLDGAGNTQTPNPITANSLLLIDVTEPPAPVVALSVPHDFGDQVRWTITQAAAGVPLGSNKGTVSFLVLPAGDPAPGQRTKLVQGIPVNDGFYTNWSATTTYAIGDIVSQGDDKWKAKTANTDKAPQAGDDWTKLSLTISTSTIGSNVFAPFLPSGARDVYFYFTSETGNVSLNTAVAFPVTMSVN